jgi:hypothetical protein
MNEEGIIELENPYFRIPVKVIRMTINASINENLTYRGNNILVNKLSYVNPLMGFGIMVGQRGLMCLLL